jgi:hypothetical protein
MPRTSRVNVEKAAFAVALATLAGFVALRTSAIATSKRSPMTGQATTALSLSTQMKLPRANPFHGPTSRPGPPQR